MKTILSIFITLIFTLFSPLNAFAVQESQNQKDNLQVAAVIRLDSDEQEDIKNPFLAMGLSFFIPGAGQIYLGEYLKGALLFITVLGLLATEIFFIGPSLKSLEENEDKNSWLEIAALITRLGLPLSWVYNWGTAYRSATPEYKEQLRKEEEERKKKEEQKKLLSRNIISVKFFSYKF